MRDEDEPKYEKTEDNRTVLGKSEKEKLLDQDYNSSLAFPSFVGTLPVSPASLVSKCQLMWNLPENEWFKAIQAVTLLTLGACSVSQLEETHAEI